MKRALGAMIALVLLMGAASAQVTNGSCGNSSLPCQVAVTGTATITGNVGGYDAQVAPTITVQNAAYSAGYSEGGLITAPLARTNGGSGILSALRLKSTGGSTNSGFIYGWSKTPVSTCTDKSAFVPSASDNPYALPGFPLSFTLATLSGAPSFDTATYAQFQNLVSNFKNQDTSPSANEYFCIVTSGSVTPATTADLSMIIGAVQD